MAPPPPPQRGSRGEVRRSAHKCCGRKSFLHDLKAGAFYWKRGTVIGAMSVTLLVCIGCEIIAVIRSPIVSRQARRTTDAYIRLLDLSDDLLYLSKLYLGEVKDIAGYKSETECAIRNTLDTIREIADNCTVSNALDLQASVSFLWNTSVAYANEIEAGELNCSSSEERGGEGFLGLFAACRLACDFASDIETARDLYENLTSSEWVAYVAGVSGAISGFADAIVESEATINQASGIVGLTDSTCSDDDVIPVSSSECGDDDTFLYLDYADDAAAVARDLDAVAECVLTVSNGGSAPTTTLEEEEEEEEAVPTNASSKLLLMLDERTNLEEFYPADCDRESQLAGLRRVLSYALLMIDWLRYGIEVLVVLCEVVQTADEMVLVMCWLLVLVVHLLTLLFLEYVVFFPTYSYKKYWKQVRSCRVVFSSKHHHREEEKETFTVRASRAAGRAAANRACDSDYHFRWWLFYLTHDVLFWALFFFAPTMLLMILGGDKENCKYVYDELATRWRTLYRRMVRTAQNSCLRDLREDSLDMNVPKLWDSDSCVVREANQTQTSSQYEGNAALLAACAYVVLVLQWHLTHWLPVAMGFARPRLLRKQLDRLDSKRHDAAPAKTDAVDVQTSTSGFVRDDDDDDDDDDSFSALASSSEEVYPENRLAEDDLKEVRDPESRGSLPYFDDVDVVSQEICCTPADAKTRARWLA